MSIYRVLFLSCVALAHPTLGSAQPACVAPALSDPQVKEIIDRERVNGEGIPAPFPKYRWLVNRLGCHYVYIEYGIPETPDYNHIVKLNQFGAIVDVRTGR